jgi:hypothetical protein
MKRIFTVGLLTAVLATGGAFAQEMVFGGDQDKADAAAVWQAMLDLKLAGPEMIRAFPYDGVAPHGMMLETFYSRATIGDHTGNLIVKRNYGPEGVSADEVMMDPGKYLGSVTVMFQREEGYDVDNQDWFWAKYLPDGSLDKNPKGMALAGRVAKGASAGCIACHSLQDDYLYTTDGLVR